MPEETTLNAQIVDSVDFANQTVIGHSASHSASMLDALMAETIGMAMHNATNAQHNAQMISSAAVTAACARMLKVQPVPWVPPPAAAANPTVKAVTPVAGQANTFTVSGTGFAPGLSVDIYQGTTEVGSVSGLAIGSLKPTSFQMESSLLTAGGTFLLQVINADQGRSAPFSYTVPVAPTNPQVNSVTPMAGKPGVYKVAGSGFGPGISVDLFGNNQSLGSVSGDAIMDVQPSSFTFATDQLHAGGTFSMQAVHPKTGRSAPYAFSLPASQQQ